MEPNITKETDKKLTKLLEDIIKYNQLYEQGSYDSFIFFNEYKNLCEFFITPIAIIDCNLNNNNLLNLELLSIRNKFTKEFLEILSKRNLKLGINIALSKVPFHQNFNAIEKKDNYNEEKIQLLQHLIKVYNINCCKTLNNKADSLRILKCYKEKLEEYKNYNEIKNYRKQKVLSH